MRRIIVAPFSNSDIRDWPAEHYAGLIEELVLRRKVDEQVWVVGTANQKMRGADIVRRFDAGRVVNACGHLSWPDLLAELRRAACVVGNNSGVAHLAGHYGVPTVCVFGGSHQRLEWGPRGSRLVLVSRAIGCSPCGLDHGASCPFDKACLTQIDAAEVADIVVSLIGAGRESAALTDPVPEAAIS